MYESEGDDCIKKRKIHEFIIQSVRERCENN